MPKTLLGPKRFMYPRPVFLVGANVNGKPNFITIGGGGVADGEPPMISIPIRHHQYTLKGILENRTFSINTPSVDQVKEVDFCGITSGRDTDKVASCGFKIFFGKPKSAPMIEQCPLNLECRLVHALNLGSHTLVIGEVIESYLNEDCVTENNPDLERIRPMIFNAEQNHYMSFGNIIAKGRDIGKSIVKK